MKFSKILTLICSLCILTYCTTTKKEESNASFIKVKNGQFFKNDKKYMIAGTNYWYGSNLAALGEEGKERLKRELDFLKSIGINNLRVQACSEGGDEVKFGVKPTLQSKPGVYNEELFDGLDFLLNELSIRDMTAVLALNNYWSWTGGMAKYVEWFGGDSIPYPSSAVLGSWDTYMRYTDQFYTNKRALDAFNKHLEVMVNRKNNYSELLYKEDPTIMAWQLGNEPRGGITEKDVNIFVNWIYETSAYIKSMDSNHMVTIGSEGAAGHHWKIADYEKANNCESIDYMTLHLWPQNWGWYNPEKPDSTLESSLEQSEKYIDEHEAIAQKLNKPTVLEEFGLARDYGHFSPDSSSTYKTKFFKFVFDKITKMTKNGSKLSGSNFWGWSGEGKINNPGEYWQKGDDLIGDPPHEPKGWYAIFQTEKEMVNVIREYNQKLVQ